MRGKSLSKFGSTILNSHVNRDSNRVNVKVNNILVSYSLKHIYEIFFFH